VGSGVVETEDSIVVEVNDVEPVVFRVELAPLNVKDAVAVDAAGRRRSGASRTDELVGGRIDSGSIRYSVETHHPIVTIISDPQLVG